jgi:hypothetical protein
MTDLRISYHDLESAHAALSGTASQFEGIQARQSRSDAAMGSGDVAGAMDGFAGNWTYHRKLLLGKMRNLGSLLTQALTQFPKADRDLSHQLTSKQRG